MPVAYVGLGSNLGDRRKALHEAALRLDALEASGLVAVSSYRETRPIGGPVTQPAFLNAAAALRTRLPPEELLIRLQQIERDLGRQQGERWGPRPIDLDLLMYDHRVLDTPDLVLPHPRMHFRRFVLEPLAQIAPQAVHPTTGRTVAELLANLNRLPHYAALAPGDDPELTRLAASIGEEIARRRGARYVSLPPVVGEDPARPRTRARGTGRERVARGTRQTGPSPLESITSAVEVLDAERAAAMPDKPTPPSGERANWLVSDFWLEDLRRAARRRVKQQQQEEFDEQSKRLCAGALEPTIVVRLARGVARASARRTASVAGAPGRATVECAAVETEVPADAGTVVGEVEAIMDAVEG